MLVDFAKRIGPIETELAANLASAEQVAELDDIERELNVLNARP